MKRITLNAGDFMDNDADDITGLIESSLNDANIYPNHIEWRIEVSYKEHKNDS